MMLSLVLMIIVIVFVAQLVLCFGAKRVWVKLIPAMLIGLGEIVCGAAYAASLYLERVEEGIYGAVFAAVIFAIVLLIVLAADAIAWLIFAIVRSVQKHKK